MLLAAAARAVLGGGRGTLGEQVDHESAAQTDAARASRDRDSGPVAHGHRRSDAAANGALLFWNGLGGFTRMAAST